MVAHTAMACHVLFLVDFVLNPRPIPVQSPASQNEWNPIDFLLNPAMGLSARCWDLRTISLPTGNSCTIHKAIAALYS